jgi:hypothetical protein
VIVPVEAFGSFERGHDLLLGQPRAVIAFDQQGNAAAVVDMSRPAYRLVEAAELFEEVTIFSKGEMDCEPRGPEKTR